MDLILITSSQPHVHADLIKAWADGATIQFWSDTRARSGKDGWMDCHNNQTSWRQDSYRVKPTKSDKELKIEQLEQQALKLAEDIAKLKE